MLEEAPELMKGRANPKGRSLTMVSPFPNTLISGVIAARELRVDAQIQSDQVTLSKVKKTKVEILCRQQRPS